MSSFYLIFQDLFMAIVVRCGVMTKQASAI
jgi:hypothetical protein